MAILTFAAQSNQAVLLPAVVLAAWARSRDPSIKISTNLVDADVLKPRSAIIRLDVDGQPASYDEDVIYELLKTFSVLHTGQQDVVKEWLDLILPKNGLNNITSLNFASLENSLQRLNNHLFLRSHIVGYVLTAADVVTWAALRGNRVATGHFKRSAELKNVNRWFKFIESTNPWMTTAVAELHATAQHKGAKIRATRASHRDGITGTEHGVVTRFPPEPSGYLHIGHAKAAWLNDYFAHGKHEGTLICRFDDTNPSKETGAFEEAILQDLQMMKIILKQSNAYADDTVADSMNHERLYGIKSARRDDTVTDNIAHFAKMVKASPEGEKWCIRAKIPIDNSNKALRDPVIFRCNSDRHHRTGRTWKVYPTYDFCAPILDSIEGVTHALRTNEYRDRNPQYTWMQTTLGLRVVTIRDFARLNFVRTCLSKRKLRQLIELGIVTGWDDPRMPTLRDIVRRGMTIPALREFILSQGPSSNIVLLDWTTFWATNKMAIEPVSPRYTAVIAENIVKATILRPRHGKSPDLGTKKVVFAGSIVLDQKDAQSLIENEEITLMNWGNAFVREISSCQSTVSHLNLELNLQGDVKTTKKKVTWLSKDGQLLTPVELVDFDFVITKDKLGKTEDPQEFLNPITEYRAQAWADCNVAGLQEGDIIQLERKGFHRVDRPFVDGRAAVLFKIPSGKERQSTD
ncbi:MAG: S-adenosyl-L-homocysteine hydrolase [Chaenotheca gracillima]|nr:MAG: S-adenosyl-L-homocysteine hydrolase [Chaenotheca gracillima]